MISGNYLNFISNRIEKLNTAIFYNFSKSLLKFPTCVIKVTGFDEDGNLWFALKKPYEDITEFDNEFPAQLKFYNKMHRFYVTVYGTATLISDKAMHADNAYIRFLIFNADYYCSKKKFKSRFKTVVFLNNLFSFENAGYHSWQFS
jgi:hypothetical protein